MSGFESVMWELERDPQLSSAFANLTMFDRPPDRERLRRKMARATLAVPRLRQRVVTSANPLERPRWVDDPDFDLDRHLRWTTLGGDGDLRELHELAATLSGQPFDRERPLWEFVTIEGLRGGKAAMLQRLHHTITDGEGGIRLSVQFLDFERDPPDDPATADDVRTSRGDGAGRADASPDGAGSLWERARDAVGSLASRSVESLVEASRNHDDVYLGASPRGSLALFNTSRAWAALQGRDYVIPDDVKDLAEPSMALTAMPTMISRKPCTPRLNASR